MLGYQAVLVFVQAVGMLVQAVRSDDQAVGVLVQANPLSYQAVGMPLQAVLSSYQALPKRETEQAELAVALFFRMHLFIQ